MERFYETILPLNSPINSYESYEGNGLFFWLEDFSELRGSKFSNLKVLNLRERDRGR